MLSQTFLEMFPLVGNLSECLQKDDHSAWSSRLSCFTTDAITFHFGAAFCLSLLCFLLSLITRNNSWVDRLWPMIPVGSAWVYTRWDDVMPVPSSRRDENDAPRLTTQFLFTLLITIWGIRLTYNFYRKGGYAKGGEDYRWAYVRTWPIVGSPLIWPLISFFFVSVYQICLILAFAAPVSLLPARPPTVGDFAMLGIQAVILVLETIADQQQWNFHQFKQNKRIPIPNHLKMDCERGFLTHGLFSISRHPNVLCEQLFWLNLYAASTLHVGFSFRFFIGPLLLVALCTSSTFLTESISAKKYPQYRLYQKSTPFIFPFYQSSTRREMDRGSLLGKRVSETRKKQ